MILDLGNCVNLIYSLWDSLYRSLEAQRTFNLRVYWWSDAMIAVSAGLKDVLEAAMEDPDDFESR